MEFSTLQLVAITLIFVWSGFIRAGIGFGGAGLSLPLLLLVEDQPLFFLPIIAIHLLIFTSITTGGRLGKIDWSFVRFSMGWMIIPKLVGVIGLLSLPNTWMVTFVFLISAFYALSWIFKQEFRSNTPWFDRLLLMAGGYVSGASLVGAPLIAAVAIRHVELKRYRDTLFVLWFLLVTIKMSTFVIVGVDLQWQWALALLLPTTLGHLVGMKFHERMLHGDPVQVKRILGFGLLLVSCFGLWQVLQ